MVEWKVGEIPVTIRRKYTEEDYRRLEIWFERRMDPTKITSVDTTRLHLLSLTKSRGAQKLVLRGRYDRLGFRKFSERIVQEAVPPRSGRVMDVSKWRNRRKAEFARISRSGRLTDELRSFQLPVPRRPMEELIAEKYGRKVSSIGKDIETLVAIGFLKRIGGNYALTKAGVGALKGWEDYLERKE